jgi:heme-degrading monooxygenase HmoA
VAHLAQVNVARLRFPLDAPAASEFVAALDRINRLADESPGFVWRHRAEHGHVSYADDPRLLLNLSVWESYPHLHAYVYRSAHGHYVRRRYEWFEPIRTPATALWWVPAGHEPTPDEALARLRYLRTYGPTARAFTVRSRFDPSGRPERRRW